MCPLLAVPALTSTSCPSVLSWTQTAAQPQMTDNCRLYIMAAILWSVVVHSVFSDWLESKDAQLGNWKEVSDCIVSLYVAPIKVLAVVVWSCREYSQQSTSAPAVLEKAIDLEIIEKLIIFSFLLFSWFRKAQIINCTLGFYSKCSCIIKSLISFLLFQSD